MFSWYFFVLCFKKAWEYKRPAYSAQCERQNRGNGLCFQGFHTVAHAQSDFQDGSPYVQI